MQGYFGKLERRFRRTAELVAARDQIRVESPQSANQVVFMPNILVQATLPHSDPGDVRAWGRRNGSARLHIQPGVEEIEPNTFRSLGVPYGSYPRLILTWLSTKIVQTRQRRVYLDDSLSAFMKQMGLDVTGGETGTLKNFKEQLRRLFAARIGLFWRDPNGDPKYQSLVVANEIERWWSPVDASETRWQTSVLLSDAFYKAVLRSAVPADNRILREIKQSSLAIDLYLWTTYRVTRIDQPLVLSWKQVHDQFGAEYARSADFAKKARKYLRQIHLLWPDLRYATPRGRLKLLPSPPSVSQQPDVPE